MICRTRLVNGSAVRNRKPLVLREVFGGRTNSAFDMQNDSTKLPLGRPNVPLVPQFPSRTLVRGPLLTVGPLAALIVADRLNGEAAFSALLEPLFAVAFFLFALGCIVQLVAIPLGLLALYRAHKQHSVTHNLALLCGCGQLFLFVLLVPTHVT